MAVNTGKRRSKQDRNMSSRRDSTRSTAFNAIIVGFRLKETPGKLSQELVRIKMR